MVSSRWEHVFALFDAALATSGAKRDEFLARECRDNAQLRDEVESLLAAHYDADGFLSADVASPRPQSPRPSSPPAGTLTAGTRVGVFAIERFAGSGGMGEVYCARDTRLDRRVALKVLPPEGATDARRRARFAYEARAIARLSHPHICALYDLGHHQGIDFLVMEYLNGETLAARLRRGPLPLNEALRIAIQISDALEAAHLEGIVHSDLKPANVMLIRSRRARHEALDSKLLDFGLARFQRVSLDADLSGASGHPGIAGTLQYMAPEQLRGEDADPRSDIFSLGCVMYEMVSGRAPFVRATAQNVMSAVLEHEAPELTFAERGTSAEFADASRRFEKVIRRCLEKTPDRRSNRVSEVKLELEEIAGATEPVHGRWSTRQWIAAVAGIAAITTIVAWGVGSRAGPSLTPTPPAKVVPLMALNGREVEPAFSPDGTQVAFSWNGEGEDNYDIYVQTVGSSDVRRLTIDPAADSLPIWSPDGRQIAFLRDHPTSGTFIYSVRPDGRDERQLADFRIGGGPSARIAWSPDGRGIVGRPDVAEQTVEKGNWALHMIPLDGGTPRRMTGAREPDLDMAPAFSPDGRRLAYVTCSGIGRRFCGINVIDVREDYTPAGPPRPIAKTGRLIQSVAWSRDGLSVVYDTNARGSWELWRARIDGATGPERLEIPGEHSGQPAIATAGNRLAFERLVERRNIFALRRNADPAPVLVSSTWDYNPQFSPDGRRIAFSSRRSADVEEIWVARADGSGAQQLTHGPGWRQTLPAWSPDGQQIAFESTAPDARSDIWVIPAEGGTPRRVTHDPGEENAPTWSHDGTRIYFLSDADGRARWPDTWQVPVAGGTPTRVTEGGSSPVKYESADGKALVYQRPALYEDAGPKPFAVRTLGDTPLMAVPLGGGTPRQLVPCVKAFSFAITATGVYFSPCGSVRYRNPGSGSIETWAPGAEIPIHVLDPATGSVRAVGTVKAPFDSTRLAVSPDGTRILVHRNTRNSDLMLIENFR